MRCEKIIQLDIFLRRIGVVFWLCQIHLQNWCNIFQYSKAILALVSLGVIILIKLFFSCSIWLHASLIFHIVTWTCIYFWYLNEATCFQIIDFNGLVPDIRGDRLILCLTHLACMRWENYRLSICFMYVSYAATWIILCNQKVYGEITDNVPILLSYRTC